MKIDALCPVSISPSTQSPNFEAPVYSNVEPQQAIYTHSPSDAIRETYRGYLDENGKVISSRLAQFSVPLVVSQELKELLSVWKTRSLLLESQSELSLCELARIQSLLAEEVGVHTTKILLVGLTSIRSQGVLGYLSALEKLPDVAPPSSLPLSVVQFIERSGVIRVQHHFNNIPAETFTEVVDELNRHVKGRIKERQTRVLDVTYFDILDQHKQLRSIEWISVNTIRDPDFFPLDTLALDITNYDFENSRPQLCSQSDKPEAIWQHVFDVVGEQVTVERLDRKQPNAWFYLFDQLMRGAIVPDAQSAPALFTLFLNGALGIQNPGADVFKTVSKTYPRWVAFLNLFRHYNQKSESKVFGRELFQRLITFTPERDQEFFGALHHLHIALSEEEFNAAAFYLKAAPIWHLLLDSSPENDPNLPVAYLRPHEKQPTWVIRFGGHTPDSVAFFQEGSLEGAQDQLKALEHLLEIKPELNPYFKKLFFSLLPPVALLPPVEGNCKKETLIRHFPLLNISFKDFWDLAEQLSTSKHSALKLLGGQLKLIVALLSDQKSDLISFKRCLSVWMSWLPNRKKIEVCQFLNGLLHDQTSIFQEIQRSKRKAWEERWIEALAQSQERSDVELCYTLIQARNPDALFYFCCQQFRLHDPQILLRMLKANQKRLSQAALLDLLLSLKGQPDNFQSVMKGTLLELCETIEKKKSKTAPLESLEKLQSWKTTLVATSEIKKELAPLVPAIKDKPVETVKQKGAVRRFSKSERKLKKAPLVAVPQVISPTVSPIIKQIKTAEPPPRVEPALKQLPVDLSPSTPLTFWEKLEANTHAEKDVREIFREAELQSDEKLLFRLHTLVREERIKITSLPPKMIPAWIALCLKHQDTKNFDLAFPLWLESGKAIKKKTLFTWIEEYRQFADLKAVLTCLQRIKRKHVNVKSKCLKLGNEWILSFQKSASDLPSRWNNLKEYRSGFREFLQESEWASELEEIRRLFCLAPSADIGVELLKLDLLPFNQTWLDCYTQSAHTYSKVQSEQLYSFALRQIADRGVIDSDPKLSFEIVAAFLPALARENSNAIFTQEQICFQTQLRVLSLFRTHFPERMDLPSCLMLFWLRLALKKKKPSDTMLSQIQTLFREVESWREIKAFHALANDLLALHLKFLFQTNLEGSPSAIAADLMYYRQRLKPDLFLELSKVCMSRLLADWKEEESDEIYELLMDLLEVEKSLNARAALIADMKGTLTLNTLTPFLRAVRKAFRELNQLGNIDGEVYLRLAAVFREWKSILVSLTEIPLNANFLVFGLDFLKMEQASELIPAEDYIELLGWQAKHLLRFTISKMKSSGSTQIAFNALQELIPTLLKDANFGKECAILLLCLMERELNSSLKNPLGSEEILKTALSIMTEIDRMDAPQRPDLGKTLGKTFIQFSKVWTAYASINFNADLCTALYVFISNPSKTLERIEAIFLNITLEIHRNDVSKANLKINATLLVMGIKVSGLLNDSQWKALEDKYITRWGA